MSDVAPAKTQIDEQELAKGVAIGLPIVTVAIASVASFMLGPPIGIIVLGAGALLGSISLLWASLRFLTGDAALGPELEALDATTHGVDALALRKKMLLRALKDLENERALGKLEAADYEQIASTYRVELKELLKRIDASLEPFREKAERLARDHLREAGVADAGSRDARPTRAERRKKREQAQVRVACPKCEASNEADAAFCKKCGTALGSTHSEGRALSRPAEAAPPEDAIGVEDEEAPDEA